MSDTHKNGYRVLKLKPLAEQMNFKPIKSFTSSEKYFEYVIEQIDSRMESKFHQFLFLVDQLYVILKPEKIEKSKESWYASPEPTKTMVEKVSHAPEDSIKNSDQGNTVKKDFKPVSLPWNTKK